MTTVGRLALALVFVVAGVGKLADRRGVVAAAEGLGVPPTVAGPVAGLLPIVELTVAAALLWRSSAAAGAAAGLFLLALFTCLVVLNLRRDRRPPCHCFGRVGGPEPIGPGTVVRNLVLMALAVAVLLTA